MSVKDKMLRVNGNLHSPIMHLHIESCSHIGQGCIMVALGSIGVSNSSRGT